MAVVSCDEMNRRWVRDEFSGQISMTVSHVAKTDSPFDGPEAVRLHANCPQPGSDYAFGSEVVAGMRFISQTIDKMPGNTRLSWIVITTYQIPRNENEDPDSARWVDEISISNRLVASQWQNFKNVEDIGDAATPQNVWRPADTAAPVQNSAGEYMTPQPQAEESTWVLTIQKIYDAYDYDAWDAFDGAINQDAVKIDRLGFKGSWDAFQMRCTGIRGARFTDQEGNARYRINFEFWIRDDDPAGPWPFGWRYSFYDFGYSIMKRPGGPDGRGGTLPSAGSAYDIVSPVGTPDMIQVIDPMARRPMKTKVPLNGKGEVLKQNTGAPSIPPLMVYKRFPEVDFTDMNTADTPSNPAYPVVWDP